MLARQSFILKKESESNKFVSYAQSSYCWLPTQKPDFTSGPGSANKGLKVCASQGTTNYHPQEQAILFLVFLFSITGDCVKLLRPGQHPPKRLVGRFIKRCDCRAQDTNIMTLTSFSVLGQSYKLSWIKKEGFSASFWV